MKQGNVTVTLEKAKEWYNSDNATLKEIALQAFSEEELNTFDFTKVKTFEDALRYFSNHNFDKYVKLREMAVNLSIISRASAAMYKLNIIRRALNNSYDMYLTKDAKGQDSTWYPCFRLITEDNIYYNLTLKANLYKKIGKIVNEGITYNVLSGYTRYSGGSGLGCFGFNYGVGNAYTDVGFLGCATENIAKHFSRYFGMLIMEAMYGDMVDFKIIE